MVALYRSDNCLTSNYREIEYTPVYDRSQYSRPDSSCDRTYGATATAAIAGPSGTCTTQDRRRAVIPAVGSCPIRVSHERPLGGYGRKMRFLPEKNGGIGGELCYNSVRMSMWVCTEEGGGPGTGGEIRDGWMWYFPGGSAAGATVWRILCVRRSAGRRRVHNPKHQATGAGMLE
jgi:hypothetical protein